MYNLLFGQQNINNIKYFGKNYTTIKLEDMPHYKFLCGHIKDYVNYLKYSWKYKQDRSINNKITKFVFLKNSIDENGINIPILTAKRFDDRKVIIHGNHRAAIAKYYNIEIKTKETNFFNFANMKHVRYGLNNGKRPYQSIFYKGKEYIKGRRRDILNRYNCIELDDILNKTVLDIGCNLGANCLLINRYTKKTIGIDINPCILDQAIKLAVYFNESIDYRLCNFATIPGKIDTCFLFAVDKHINNDKKIARFINNKVRRIVYFETHENSNFPKPIKKCFSKLRMLRNQKGRKLYRCEK